MIESETIEKMLKWARKSYNAAKDQEEQDQRLEDLFEIAQLTVIQPLSEKQLQSLTLDCVENDWQNILWCIVRYNYPSTDELVNLHTLTDKQWIHDIVAEHVADYPERHAAFEEKLGK